MRLRRLYLPKFRVLKELELSFSIAPDEGDRRYGLALLVGNNGSGKSTVLQALASLFSGLYQNGGVDFPFEVEYDITSTDGSVRTVVIKQKKGEDLASMYVDGEKLWSDGWLPDRVICYSTGRQTGWGEATPEEDDVAGEDNQQHSRLSGEQPYRPQQHAPVSRGRSTRVRLIRLDRLPHVTIAGWVTVLAEVAERLARDGQADRKHRLEKVLVETKIKAITGFSLRLRIPERLHPSDRDRVNRVVNAASDQQGSRHDLLLRFDLREQPEAIATELLKRLSEAGTGFGLFDALDRLSEPGREGEPILQEVSIFLERTGGDKEPAMLHSFDWLSDGEQSFVGRMAMLCLVGTPRSLVLVDEPEVHFNDFWKRLILSTLDASESLQDCHVILATHSSVALTDVQSKHVRVLKRSAAHTTQVTTPAIQTYAADPSEIMVRVFDAPFAIGARSAEELWKLLERLDSEEEGPKVLLDAHRQLETMAPGYWSYKLRQAIARREDRPR